MSDAELQKIIAAIDERRVDVDAVVAWLGGKDGVRKDRVAELLSVVAEERILLDVARTLTAEIELDNLWTKILDLTKRALRADRVSLFLVDREKGELTGRVAQGLGGATLRLPIGKGIAGWVAREGSPLNIEDAYSSPLFNQEFDKKTGYRTKSVLSAPIKNISGETTGVIQVINSEKGRFDESDEHLLFDLAGYLALSLDNAILYQRILARERQVSTLLSVASSLSSKLDLDQLMELVMKEAAAMLDADRSTLFLIDEEKSEIWSKVAQGLDKKEIRIPLGKGIAGTVAATGKGMNIPEAYDHPLFNPEVDKKTGYRTKSILALPVTNARGKTIGVAQLINKRVGVFDADDEKLLAAFSSQAGIALENARLFEYVRRMKDYLERVLESVSNGVVSTDPAMTIVTANSAAQNIIGNNATKLVGRPIGEVFAVFSPVIAERLSSVAEGGRSTVDYDVEAKQADGKSLTVNSNVAPLVDPSGKRQGVVLVLEDITREKRVKSTLSRYMSKEVADRLMGEDGQQRLGGVRQEVTVLFSDIRSYTSLTENSDATAIVAMLNEYFGYMVDAVFENGGILDKFIGDAIMAVFGAPFSRPKEDPLNAVKAALEMQRKLALLNIQRTAQGKPALQIGIGISTGDVVCGNIGSEKRMEYTAIGDGVNLASRLEGATKQYGTSLLVADATADRVRDLFHLREVDLMRVKGKKKPVRTFDVFGPLDKALDPYRRELLERHDAAMTAYRSRDFSSALDIFGDAAERFPNDKLFKMYADRCATLKLAPPPSDWDGVWDLHEK